MESLEVRQIMRLRNVKRYEIARELERTPSTISVWLKEGKPENLRLMLTAIDAIKEREGTSWNGQLINRQNT